ncbi:NADH-quinone oxidoreductase subunit H [Actinomadura madurae]|uniref:NADH-quinone oxidoreductase subunit H n=1 Tax=Actinomadura madurae TaxID=1993 RepID=UPI0020D20F3B|nr:NADH-quinone oxidoreductase subunit H [Actinomadura madurae]MCP9971078.1 NADH-quinone oxidoreductase subunit H [Actinomadura madurae]
MAEVLVLGVLALAAAALNGAFAGRPAEPFREAARLLTSQRRVTAESDVLLTRIGVISLPVAAALAALVVPLGGSAAVGTSVGVVWFNAMEVVAWASVWLAGWGVNSAFGLVGGYRFLAQGLAYELPHMFALITAALGAHSLDLRVIGGAQDGLWFAVWMPVAFAVYLVSAAAMAFWGPFGHPARRRRGRGRPGRAVRTRPARLPGGTVRAADGGRGRRRAAVPRRRFRSAAARRGCGRC